MLYGTRCFPLSPLPLKLLNLSQGPVLPGVFSEAYILLGQWYAELDPVPAVARWKRLLIENRVGWRHGLVGKVLYFFLYFPRNLYVFIFLHNLHTTL